MLLINLIFKFCVVIVQAGCTPRAWLPSDLATSPLVCNLYMAMIHADKVMRYKTIQIKNVTLAVNAKVAMHVSTNRIAITNY